MMDWDELNRVAGEMFRISNPDVPMLLLAWAEHDSDGELARFLESAGLSISSLVEALRLLTEENREEDKSLVTHSILSAGDEPMTGRHLLKTLCEHPEHRIMQALAVKGLNLAALQKTLVAWKREPAVGVLARHGIGLDTDASPILRYGRDLTALAQDGAFEGYCDRREELDTIATVLLRMERGNAMLTGEAGVGKTALVELLAREIVAGRVGGIDAETRVFEASIGKLVAGTQYRGQFEQRLNVLVEAVLACLPAFLFLDEAHLLFGTGRAEGAPLDIGNLLKPFLARGDLRVIAATTADEYNRYIARDEALARRFEEIRVPEPEPSLTASMVHARAVAMASGHGVRIPEPLVSRAIELTNEHLSHKLQPYKTIDLIDTASAKTRQAGKEELTEAVLLQVLAKSTGRSFEELKGNDRKPLRDLATSLRRAIIGQDDAIDKVVATVVRQRQKLGAPDRNLGTFLFVGPTGVGKSELGKQLAGALFGGLRSLLHLDMAEYENPGDTNKLIGAPAGFVGSENEGALIRWLINHPSGGVLLFDEIEKAHAHVHNLSSCAGRFSSHSAKCQ